MRMRGKNRRVKHNRVKIQQSACRQTIFIICVTIGCNTWECQTNVHLLKQNLLKYVLWVCKRGRVASKREKRVREINNKSNSAGIDSAASILHIFHGWTFYCLSKLYDLFMLYQTLRLLADNRRTMVVRSAHRKLHVLRMNEWMNEWENPLADAACQNWRVPHKLDH